MVERKIHVKPYGATSRAHFLRQNPRFINDPICTVENPTKSVADCMTWSTKGNRAVSLARRMMKPPPSDQKSMCGGSSMWTAFNIRLHDGEGNIMNVENRLFSRKKNFRKEYTQPLIKGILDPQRYASGQTLKERMSFRQQYDCRIDPSLPIKGKRQGCFVWESL